MNSLLVVSLLATIYLCGGQWIPLGDGTLDFSKVVNVLGQKPFLRIPIIIIPVPVDGCGPDGAGYHGKIGGGSVPSGLSDSMKEKSKDERSVENPTDTFVQSLSDLSNLDLEGSFGGPQDFGNSEDIYNLTALLQGAPCTVASIRFIPLVTLLYG